nr:MAG TPA: helix-turn-helix domain protein [Caudoviricetes sp.]
MMYSVSEVADIFNVSVQTVRNWIYTKKINAVQIDRAFRIDESEIEKLKKDNLYW